MELKGKEQFQAVNLFTDNSLQYELSPPRSHYLMQPIPNTSEDNIKPVFLDKTFENIAKDEFKKANPPTSSLIPEEVSPSIIFLRLKSKLGVTQPLFFFVFHACGFHSSYG